MKAWYNFLLELEKKLGTNTVEKWLANLKVIKFDACNLYLEAENFFQAQWFEEHIRPIVKKGFYNQNFRPIKIHLSVSNVPNNVKVKEEKKELLIKSDSLDSHLTFPLFIATQKNMMALQVLKESIYKNATFNPIFLYGPKNSGKTHILQACCHKYKELKKNVFYIKAQTFTSHVVEAIRTAQMQSFRKAYRNLDALIIDDIHVLAKKFATQEEFFHTFNSLHMEGKTIILSANGPANTLIDIEERLISRFEWGIALPIEKLTDLKFLLKSQLSLLNLQLPKETEKYLLDNFKNITSLKKAIKTLALNIHFDSKENLDLESVKFYLSALLKEENEIKITPNKIVNAVSNYFGITNVDILGKSQTKESTYPRQFSMYLCRELLKMPYMKIGSFFQRDHSTVMTSVKAIKHQISNQNKEIHLALLDISKKLENF